MRFKTSGREQDEMDRILLTGGTVVSGSGSAPADVLIEGEKIVSVGTAAEMAKLAGSDAQICDVSGCLLFPGFIDAHTHFDLHVAGTVTADDFETGTRAAIQGGTCLLYTSDAADE